MPITTNITVAHKFYLGTNKTLRMTLTGSGDITGWAIRYVLTSKLPSPEAVVTALIDKAVGTGINIVDGPNRIVDVVFTDDETDGSGDQFQAGKKYFYSIKRTDPGFEDILAEGTWEFCVASQRQE